MSAALRTVIVDDEKLAQELLRNHLGADPEINIVGEAVNADDALSLIKENVIDLMFLDVQMPEKDGFELLSTLYNESIPIPQTIFVTAYESYAVRAFEQLALGYILKPIDKARLLRVTQHAKQRLREGRAAADQQKLGHLAALREQRIIVKSRGRLRFIRIHEIDWIEAEGNYLKLHQGDHTHVIRETLKQLEERLRTSGFVRIHKSVLVNIARVEEVIPWYTGEAVIRLNSGKELTLTRSYRDSFLSLMETLT
jgi:two-component system, LytTR family, response regulator